MSPFKTCSACGYEIPAHKNTTIPRSQFQALLQEHQRTCALFAAHKREQLETLTAAASRFKRRGA